MSLATAINHPLEPLAADEVQHAIELLRNAGKVTPTTRFVSVTLLEPDKASVHARTTASELPRSAKAIAVRQRHELLLRGGRLAQPRPQVAVVASTSPACSRR